MAKFKWQKFLPGVNQSLPSTELADSTLTATIPPNVLLKSLLAQGVFGSYEWSGYAPYVAAPGGWRLLDLYILSAENSGGHTVLGPEATASAWMKAMAEHPGADIEGLAWCHRHLGRNAFWSLVDDHAVDRMVEAAGGVLSVEFAGIEAIARYDTASTHESLLIVKDWGDMAAEVNALEAMYQASHKTNQARKAAMVRTKSPNRQNGNGNAYTGMEQCECGTYTSIRCDLCDAVACSRCRKKVDSMELCSACVFTFYGTGITSEPDYAGGMQYIGAGDDHLVECTCCHRWVVPEKMQAVGPLHLWCDDCRQNYRGLASYFEEVEHEQAKE